MNLVAIYIQIASSVELNEDIRIMALNSITWCVIYHKSNIIKQNALPIIINMLFTLVSSIPIEEDEDEDDEFSSLSQTALTLLSQISINTKPSHFFPLLSDAISKSASNNDWISSMLCIGAIVEGSVEYIGVNIEIVMEAVLKCLSFTDKSVFEAACRAATALAGINILCIHLSLR